MSLSLPALHLDATSAVPPFEQLRSQIARLAATGELAPGDKLPTVRQLAADLGLAANTVARSYRELEADGVLSTQGRRGTFIRRDPDMNVGEEDLARQAGELAAMARRAGVSLPETVRLVERAWAER